MQSLQAAWDALRFGGPMVYPLLALALIALVIMIDKGYVFWRHARLPEPVVRFMETYGFDWEELEQRLGTLGDRNLLAGFFQVIAQHRHQPAWWVESRAGDEAHHVEKSLSRGLWVLETIVTAAPLMGLLGTITGMMAAFRLIGGNGLVDPTGVTSGVAEALIATALGLLIALVALFGFNFFSRQQARTLDEMERLGTRLVDHIRLDQEDVEPTRRAVR